VTNKYFEKMEMGTIKIVLKQGKILLKLLRGGIRLLPDLIDSIFLGKIKRLFFSEHRLFEKNRQKMLKLNDFNI